MAVVPTVVVKIKATGVVCLINESDFDKDKHQKKVLAEEKPADKEEAVARDKAPRKRR